jgi:hypothetical protein
MRSVKIEPSTGPLKPSRRPRSGEIIDWSASQGSPKRVLSEIVSNAGAKRGSFYEEDLAVRRLNAKHYSIVNGEAAAREPRPHGYFGNDRLDRTATQSLVELQYPYEQEDSDRGKILLPSPRVINFKGKSNQISEQGQREVVMSRDSRPVSEKTFSPIMSLQGDYKDGTAVPSDDEAVPVSTAFTTASGSLLSPASGLSVLKQSTATRMLISIFCNNQNLRPLYTAAIYGQIGPHRFTSHLRELLKTCSRDLREEAQDRTAALVAQLVTIKARYIIETVLEKYQTSLSLGISDSDRAYEQSVVDSSSDEEELAEIGFEDVSFAGLADAGAFLLESAALENFRLGLRHLVSSPGMLSTTIDESGEQSWRISNTLNEMEEDPDHAAMHLACFLEDLPGSSTHVSRSHKQETVDEPSSKTSAQTVEDDNYYKVLNMLEKDKSLDLILKHVLATIGSEHVATEYSHIHSSTYGVWSGKSTARSKIETTQVDSELLWRAMTERIAARLESADAAVANSSIPGISSSIPETSSREDKILEILTWLTVVSTALLPRLTYNADLLTMVSSTLRSLCY